MAAQSAPEIEPETDEGLPEEISVEDAIAAELASSPGEVAWAVKVYRVAENNKPEAFLFNCDPSDLNIAEKLRDVYGTGNYRVRVYANQRIRFNRPIAVEAPPKPITPVQPLQTDSAIVQVLEKLVQSNERLQERLNQQQPQALSKDRFAEFREFVTVFKEMAPAQTTAAPAFDLASMLTMVKSGVELFRDLGIGGGAAETNVLDVVRDLVKNLPLTDILGAVAAARAPGAPVQPMLPQPEQSPAVPPPQPASTGNQLLDVLREPLAFLVVRAQRNAPVDAAVDWTFSALALEGVPDEVVVGLLQRPDLLQVLSAVEPRVAEPVLKPWFEKLVAGARQAMFEPDVEEPNADAAGQPAADLSPNTPG